jgi:uncharacterized protein
MSRNSVHFIFDANEMIATTSIRSRSRYRRIFWGTNGLRAGWRIVLFAAISYGIFHALLWVAEFILHSFEITTEHPPDLQWTWVLLLVESLFLVTAVTSVKIMAMIEKHPLSYYWFPLNKRSALRFGQGLLWGIVLISTLILLIHFLGGYSFGSFSLSRRNLFGYCCLWLVTAFVNGFAENLLFIGYPLFTMKTGIGFWPASIVLGLLFTAAHGHNSGENLVGLISLFLQFLFFVLTIYRTGDLWLSIGVHAGGVFAENFLFSAPDSGVRYSGHLSNASFHGKAWITGGSVGPEGSLVAFFIFVLAIFSFNLIHQDRQGKSPLRRQVPSLKEEG